MKHVYLSFLIIIVCSLNACQCHKEKKTIVIDGSTTIEPIIRKAVAVFFEKRGIEVVIHSTGSHAGIDALIDRTCDIAESSSPLSADEKARAAEKGLGIQEYAIARDLIVPIVHKHNPLKDIAMTDLKNVFSGAVRQWDRYGWDVGEIHVVMRDNHSGTQTVWNGIVLGNALEFASAERKASTSSVLSAVAENRKAIGYVSYSFLNSDIKALSVNGRAADVARPDPA